MGRCPLQTSMTQLTLGGWRFRPCSVGSRWTSSSSCLHWRAPRAMCAARERLGAVASGWRSALAATYCRMVSFRPTRCSSLNSLAGVLELLGVLRTL